MPNSKHIALAVAAVFIAATAHAETPQRVVSMNLCTDQLAMMLAAPDQLYSVSYLSQDAESSPMAEAAMAFRPNTGLAEEIYLMDPDLVIAGSFSSRTTLDMLRRLDVPVVVFDPASTLADIPARIAQMGDVLGREAAAEALIDDFNARLEALSEIETHRPRAALYSANGWSSGSQTLPGQIVEAAGFDNIADEMGLNWGGFIPLELLAMADPDVVITGKAYRGASRAEDILLHPVVTTLQEGRFGARVTDQDWVCGTPLILDAIEELVAERRTAAEDNG